MDIIISALHFAWQDMNDCLMKATRELGLDGVELSWHESFCRPHCTAEDMDDLASRRGKHDWPLSAHNDDHTPYRQGTVAWDDVFARLRHISFNGVFCIEFPVGEDRTPFLTCVKEIRDRWSMPTRPSDRTQ